MIKIPGAERIHGKAMLMRVGDQGNRHILTTNWFDLRQHLSLKWQQE